MNEESNRVRRNALAVPQLDATDRTLLRLLSADASRSYADLGEAVHLSPPAVHERVRKLKRAGVIQATTLALDGTKLGRSLLAFVHVDTTGWGKSPAMLALRDDPRVEELHSVAGDTCMLIKARCVDTIDLEDLLRIVYGIPGVTATRSYIALQSYLERGPQP
jgi:Lrp/AsnC family transcriptional regulator, leucine-responsive regulatory protein